MKESPKELLMAAQSRVRFHRRKTQEECEQLQKWICPGLRDVAGSVNTVAKTDTQAVRNTQVIMRILYRGEDVKLSLIQFSINYMLKDLAVKCSSHILLLCQTP